MSPTQFFQECWIKNTIQYSTEVFIAFHRTVTMTFIVLLLVFISWKYKYVAVQSCHVLLFQMLLF